MIDIAADGSMTLPAGTVDLVIVGAGAAGLAAAKTARARGFIVAVLEAKDRIGGRLFFAGEATSPDFYTTAHGAYLIGIEAATAASRVLARD
jgi:monoamine oxidase